MIKLRVYFVDDKKGNVELEEALKRIAKEFNIISKSKVYKNSRGNKYLIVYIDVENKEER
ncbi:MAG: hypothetical protein KH333_09765 [Clostridium sp.]|nr:hypothetical protein [Clostridium sp.]